MSRAARAAGITRRTANFLKVEPAGFLIRVLKDGATWLSAAESVATLFLAARGNYGF